MADSVYIRSKGCGCAFVTPMSNNGCTAQHSSCSHSCYSYRPAENLCWLVQTRLLNSRCAGTVGGMAGLPGSPMGIIVSVENSAEFVTQLKNLLDDQSAD